MVPAAGKAGEGGTGEMLSRFMETVVVMLTTLSLRGGKPGDTRPSKVVLAELLPSESARDSDGGRSSPPSSSVNTSPGSTGDPTVISVFTELLCLLIVSRAASLSVATIAGPEKMVALVMCAHCAMWKGPFVYCLYAVPGCAFQSAGGPSMLAIGGWTQAMMCKREGEGSAGTVSRAEQAPLDSSAHGDRKC